MSCTAKNWLPGCVSSTGLNPLMVTRMMGIMAQSICQWRNTFIYLGTFKYRTGYVSSSITRCSAREFVIFVSMPHVFDIRLIVIALIAMAGCEAPEPPSAEKLSFPLERLVGKWQDVGRDHTFFEQWKLVGDKHLRGKGYVMASSDTVFIERLEIKTKGDELLYRVGLSNKESDELVEFRLTSETASRIVFENKNHDFPKKIIYEIDDSSTMRVLLTGHEAGQYTEIEFSFIQEATR